MSETLNSQSGVLNEVVNEPVAKAAGSPAEETMVLSQVNDDTILLSEIPFHTALPPLV